MPKRNLICEIRNERCEETMREMKNKVQVILTSPPYNTSRANKSERAMKNHEKRYDVHIDTMSQDDYCSWVVGLFNMFDNILDKDGVVLWNVSYGTDLSVNKVGFGTMWVSIADIISLTNFTVADRIIWKKKTALPNNVSKNKLTRICEDVFVFCRKSEVKTFNMNKKVSSVSKTGQMFYENYYNFIEAKNNDGSCNLNKATYSSDLCVQLLSMYAKSGDTIYDPFNGTGTTGVACKMLNMNYIGSEISAEQCKYSEERIRNL